MIVKKAARFTVRHLKFLLVLIVFGCSPLPQGSGPSPNQILVVSAESYQSEKIIQTISAAKLGLDDGFDKSSEVIEIGDSKHPRYPQYEIAYWYPYNDSKFYGVAIVKWAKESRLSHKYFIDIYSEDKKCGLCEGVTRALKEAGIVYYSACEQNPRKSNHEEARCQN